MNLYPLSTPRGSHDETILEFAAQMTQLASYPTHRAYCQNTITSFFKNAGYLVKYHKCLYGEISEIRYFMPHPTNGSFLEVEEEMVIESRKEEHWRESLKYLKLRCDSHPGPFFICRIVQREESPNSPMTKQTPAVKRTEVFDKIFDEEVIEG
jgi:hypothetical protein